MRAALENLDCLITIDSLPTDTAKLAHVAFADLPAYGKDGTYTNADRRIVRLSRGESPAGDQRDCHAVLAALGNATAERLGKTADLPPEAETLMEEIAATNPAYAGADYRILESGRTRTAIPRATEARLQPISLPRARTAGSDGEGRLVLTTARTLYTSLEGASIRAEDADKLHREEFLEINPADAAALGIGQNRPVTVQNGGAAYTFSAALSDAVAPGSVFLPLYFEGGVVNSLLPADSEAPVTVTVRPA